MSIAVSAAGAAQQQRKLPKVAHIPSLDGLRAISISLVLFGHLVGTRNFGRPDPGLGDVAHLGVVVFLVISGFLITSLLLKEHAQTGTVSLKLFYARRSLRIFPASYAFLACVGLLWLGGTVHLRAADIWHAASYTVNYADNTSWEVAHLWSLSIEEQFYLLWPFAFVALGPRRATWIAAAVILLGPVARFTAWLFLRHSPPWFPMVADSLAVGCLLARMQGWLESQPLYLHLFRPAWAFLILALVLLLNRLMGFTVVMVFGTAAINLLIAVLIHRCVYYSRDRVGRVLNWKPLASVGVLSYSLYLWQQLFLNRNSTAWANAFPQNLIFAVGAALSSYLLLEKPLLALRRRLRAERC